MVRNEQIGYSGVRGSEVEFRSSCSRSRIQEFVLLKSGSGVRTLEIEFVIYGWDWFVEVSGVSFPDARWFIQDYLKIVRDCVLMLVGGLLWKRFFDWSGLVN